MKKKELLWDLPKAYVGGSFLLGNHSNMLCFIWCIRQREDLPDISMDILYVIWKIACPPINWNAWCDAIGRGGGDQIQVRWDAWEEIYPEVREGAPPAA